MIVLRSLLYNLVFYLLTAVMTVTALPLLLAPRPILRAAVKLWAWLLLALLRVICGVRVRVLGREHLPKPGPDGGAALVAAKHQSAFDTLIWLLLLPDAAYVLKQELLHIPVWGWHARRMRMIGVDRKAGAQALRSLVKQGKEAAAEGRQLVIFPEGTRTAPGERHPYQPGIAALAQGTGLPVIPAATDSGRFWGRRTFLKHPGTLTVSILPPLPAGLPRAQLLPRLEEAIETESLRLLKACG